MDAGAAIVPAPMPGANQRIALQDACCRLRAKRKTAHQDITALAIELQLPQPDITVLAMCRLRRTRPRWGCPVRYRYYELTPAEAECERAHT